MPDANITYSPLRHRAYFWRNFMNGIVKWFSKEKGFGFIQPDKKDEKDIFVHYSDIEGDGFKTLIDGQHVEYEIQEGPKGPKAKNVKVVPVIQGNKGDCTPPILNKTT